MEVIIPETLESKLFKIRKQQNSKLPQQSHVALILSAVEENLTEEQNEKSPAAYFVSALSLLDQCVSESTINDKDLANSVVYLLNIVASFVSANLLRAKFATIASRLAVVLSHTEAEAPIIRSSIGVLEAMLLAQDLSSWSAPLTQMSPKRAFMGLTTLALDPRPKIRKRAQQAVHEILNNKPPGPKIEHPGANICAEVALKSMAAKNEKSTEVHTLQFIKIICDANAWPSDLTEDLCHKLLEVSGTTDNHLIIAAFDVFDSLFKSMSDSVDSPKLTKILTSIFDLAPSTKNTDVAPAWLAVVAEACSCFAQLEPLKAFLRLPKIFETIIEYLEAESAENVHISAAECLIALIHTTIPDEALSLKTGKKAEEYDIVLEKLCDTLFSLLHIKYHQSWNEISRILVSMFERLRWKSDPFLINSLKVVGSLRSQEEFADGLEGCDKVISAAINSLGPEVVISHLPLQLTPPNGKPFGRVWLLPLLRDNVQHASLGHFRRYFLPLAETISLKIEELNDLIAADPGAKSSPVELKIYQTIYDQIWSLLPRYMDLPTDLIEEFDQKFAEMLSNNLYQNIEQRPLICQSLKLLVQSNVAYAEGAVDDDRLMLERFSKKQAKNNIDYVAKNFAAKILSVLFNVFSQSSADSRGFVLEAILAYLEIASSKDLTATFNKVSSLLHNSMSEKKFDVSSTMMDLIVAMSPFLPADSHSTLLTIFNAAAPLKEQPQLQKKAFRIITKLASTEKGEEVIKKYVGQLEEVLIDLTDKVTAPSRGARLQAIFPVIDQLPDSDLHFIPAVLSETVLATKDVNEKTRTAAFDLLAHFAKKMQKGGIVDLQKVYGESNAPISASLEEFFMMVSAGLVGSTPYMISATITALSKILYEFREELSKNTLEQLSSTVEMFLTSKNREIVKSTLGFVKVTVIALPIEIIEPNLKNLVEHLLSWSHEHKAHFGAKVKHIIERLIRRFGYDAIAAIFPAEDAKLLTNIRKTKERAKRKAKTAANEKDGGRVKRYTNEFEQAVYGSDSEEESEEENEKSAKHSKDSKNSKNTKDRYIMENDDEPLDLLDSRALAKISSSKPVKNKRAAPQLKNKFDQDVDGKIVIKTTEDNDDVQLDSGEGISAYVTAVQNGPVRGQRNKLKYRRSKKHRHDSEDEEDEGGFDDDFRKSKSINQRKKMKIQRKKL